MPNRNEKLLRQIDKATQVGVEIGPLNRPVVRKSEGRIYFVDYTTLEDLKKIHSVDPNIPLNDIPAPDFIWGKQALADCLAAIAPIDYLIAAHVIEHVPDLVGWLHEVAAVLKDGGVLSLAIPDKRFTFDYLRPLTSLGDVLEAHWEKRRRPSLRHVWDAVAMSVKLDGPQAWSAPQEPGRLKNYHTFQTALDAVNGVRSDPAAYYDCHCWVVTPRHLLRLLRSLAELKLLDFEVVELETTQRNEIEFFVTLRRLPSALNPTEKLQRQLKSIDRWTVDDMVPYQARPRQPLSMRTLVRAVLPRPVIEAIRRVLGRS